MDNLVLLEAKREGGKYLLFGSPCEGPQKHPLSITGCRRNMEVQGFTQCALSGGKDYCLRSSIPNIF